MATYIVYVHENKTNKKKYVGITSQTIQQRWRSHGQGYAGQEKFYRAIVKYGWDNFNHLIIATNLSKEQAEEKEKELIQQYDSIVNGYNVELGGSSAQHSEITKEKIRQAMIGKTHTQATKDKISQAKASSKKAVVCVELNQTYVSLKEASLATGLNIDCISKACHGKSKTSGGYHWHFAEDNNYAPSQDKRVRAVVCITTGKTYSSISEAAKDTQSDISNIKKVCDGKYKTTNQLKWRWANKDEV